MSKNVSDIDARQEEARTSMLCDKLKTGRRLKLMNGLGLKHLALNKNK